MANIEHKPGNTYSLIGIMSGTSMDGVDIAHCVFSVLPDAYSYSITKCETIPYPPEWMEQLKNLPMGSAPEYASVHVLYGHYLGKLVRQFCQSYQLQVDFVASHGHTIFHQPEKQFTSQIGDGAALAAECGFPVICDFRSSDVAHGGQGAPLVPIGEALLFREYTYCLNLGGFANISFEENGKRVAFDICPANFILNYLANQAGQSFDEGGKIAASGNINPELLRKLNALPYYTLQHPKSLGREWTESEILPLFSQLDCPINDKMRTAIEHIAMQVKNALHEKTSDRLLITGGGALNQFLVERIKGLLDCKIILPEREIIDYKEALIFAFLGLLRILNKPNCLKSVTGAQKDVCGGAIYLP